VLAGILFQLGTMTIFAVLAIDFIVRVILRKPWSIRRRATLPPTTQPTTYPETVEVPGEDEPRANAVSATESEKNIAPVRTSANDLRQAEWLLAGIAFASIMIYVRGV